MVVYADGDDFEDAVAAKIDEGDYEVLGHNIDDWDFLEDWDRADLEREYAIELKHEEQEEMRRTENER